MTTDDHADYTLGVFHNYARLPTNLGDVIEIGCGPFTQLRTILGVKGRNWSVGSVTLVDPIIESERQHPHSSFKSGKFTDLSGKVYPTTLIEAGAEDVGQLFHNKFDVVIMQNVLEHVSDSLEVLGALFNITKPGGVVLVWEPFFKPNSPKWEESQTGPYSNANGMPYLLDFTIPNKEHIPTEQLGNFNDYKVWTTSRSRAIRVLHPIRPGRPVFQHFASSFDPLSVEWPQDARNGDGSFAFIGRKPVNSRSSS
jgi:SAM-dependent methyltransferase